VPFFQPLDYYYRTDDLSCCRNIEEGLGRLRWHQDPSGGQHAFEFVEGLLSLDGPSEVLGLFKRWYSGKAFSPSREMI